MAVKKLLHTRMRVNDLERTVKFYQEALGLTLARRSISPRGAQIAFLATPNSEEKIEICQLPNSPSVQVQPDLMHLAFEVDDLAAFADGRDPGDFVHAALAAVWSREMDIADDETLRTLAGECGLDGAALLARAETEEIQAVWDANSDEAIERGVFGSPFYFVGDEPFWGQDRLDLLSDALTGEKA